MLSACEKLKIHGVPIGNAGKSRRGVVKKRVKTHGFSF
jgi:hypothetical protein